MNLSKLNYILIPSSKEERERLQSRPVGKVFRFLFRVYFMFSREGRVLFFLWMLTSIMSINIGFTQYYVAWSVLTGVLFGSFLFRRWVTLDGVALGFTGPQRATVGEEVHLSAEIKNHSDKAHQAIRLERPFLTWDGTYTSPFLSVSHLDPGEHQSLPIRVLFIARGEHILDPLTARALAPFGLAMGPSISSLGLTFLIIPKIKPVAHIDIDTTMKYQPGGVALASTTGEAQELVGVRPYRPGDPIRDIHSKTWARIGEPAVREYQQEYFTRIGIFIDTEGGVSDEPDFEGMISLAAGIVARLSHGEALLDLLVIGSDVHELTLGRSLGFMEQALDLLACVEPQGAFQASSMQHRLAAHLSRLSCVIIVSLRWDEERQQFAEWIEHQQVRCRRIIVTHKKPVPFAEETGATLIKLADIQREGELII